MDRDPEAKQGHDVLVVSSDKDFAQIVGDKIKIMLPPPSANPKLGWRLLDAAGVQDKFGVPPQVAHYLALVDRAILPLLPAAVIRLHAKTLVRSCFTFAHSASLA